MLNFAIIGVGRMGKIHAANLYNHVIPGARLQAVCDNDPTVLSQCETCFPTVHRYLDYHDLLTKEKLDGVLIATPHYSHGEIAKFFISHHLATLIEKPLAVTAKEAQSVMEVAKANPDTLACLAFNQRSNRVYQAMKEIVDKGELGTIRSARFEISDWYRCDSYYRTNPWRASYGQEGGGCLINQCAHQLDLIIWILGLPTKVWGNCQTIGRNISCENEALAILTYPTFRLVFTASCHDASGINCFEVSGDKGRVTATKEILTVRLHDDDSVINHACQTDKPLVRYVKRKTHYGTSIGEADKRYGQQHRCLFSFRDAILGRDKPLASLEDGLKEDQLLNAIYYSFWTGKEVSVPVDPDTYEKALKAKIAEEEKTRR
jgi:UDP-N-acetyl-2-amino-2-deoxyglucuronate dehydrogenase